MNRAACGWRVLRRLTSIAVIAAVSGCMTFNPLAPGKSVSGISTTIILVRHAERDPGLDPPLNAEGQIRAQKLADVLSENGITAIFCADLIRNKQTAEPIAAKLGLTPKLWNPLSFANTTAFANEVVNDIFANHAGGTVLFIGNIGSTIGTPGINEEIYKRLGGTGTPPNKYQDLYIMVVTDTGLTRFIKTTYGGVSSLTP